MWPLVIFSPSLLLTWRHCRPCTKNWLSSENKTFFQSSALHSLEFFANESLLFHIFSVKSYFRCALLAFLQAKTSLLLTRDALILTPECSKSYCRPLLVFLGLILLFLMTYTSPFGVVFLFRPHFPFRLAVNDPVALNCLITRLTVLWIAPTVLAISRDDLWQCWWRVTILERFFGVVSAIYFCLSATKLTKRNSFKQTAWLKYAIGTIVTS